ncbi:ATP-binding protein [Singulisphaera sp. PoT]|uniref:ATP-binding protein n=1 Tax=Singulisphaera sp. PoT TaxID=3411797 RepID=UPI003BF50B63
MSVHDLLRPAYRVLTCERGTEALKILESPTEVDVVLTDQRMPEMNGVEVLHRAKQIRPEVTRLLFTAYADIRAVVDAINQGSVYRYIAKPWEPEELEALVRQAVDHHDLIVEKKRLVNELRESNQRLMEANRLKEAFLEVASHELNTPVTVILGMTELWKLTQSGDATATENGWVDRIHGAGKRLATTVDRMLKLARSGDFAKTMTVSPTDLAESIRNVVAEMEPYLSARSQTVELDLAPDLGEAEVDASKFSDIFTNLLINAIKFAPDGSSIQIGATCEGEDHVRFQIRDSGIGIGKVEHPHLFEPFFTGFDTRHHSSGDYQFCKKGMGLGLCLVKTFVKLHGGEIEVTSTPGEGSTFTIDLPRFSAAKKLDTVSA